MRSLENGRPGIGAGGKDDFAEDAFANAWHAPTEAASSLWSRLCAVVGTVDPCTICGIDPWFLHRIADMVASKPREACALKTSTPAMRMLNSTARRRRDRRPHGHEGSFVRAYRKGLGVVPTLRRSIPALRSSRANRVPLQDVRERPPMRLRAWLPTRRSRHRARTSPRR